MSEETLRALRRGVELLNAGPLDLEAGVSELYHADVEVRDLQPPPDVPGVVRGRDAAIASLAKWMELFDDWSVEVARAIQNFADLPTASEAVREGRYT